MLRGRATSAYDRGGRCPQCGSAPGDAARLPIVTFNREGNNRVFAPVGRCPKCGVVSSYVITFVMPFGDKAQRMIRNRLSRLERILKRRTGGTCALCRGGDYPFLIRRWISEDGGSRDEPESSDVYGESGNCRQCGGAAKGVVVLVLCCGGDLPGGSPERTAG
jgi:hypothetical protein